jgi:hypothetical protein
MRRNEKHLSDLELVLFSDQERATRRAAKAREHVAQCEACRRRLADLEAASDCFADLHGQDVRALSSGALNSRDLLKSRLVETSARAGQSPAPFGRAVALQLASACFALLLVAGVVWTVRRTAQPRSASDAMNREFVALPRRALTPGSIRAVGVGDLCGAREIGNDPPVVPSIEQAVFQEYDIPASSRRDYELDYLITPALGGAASIQNLWPQPNSSPWNASVKDQLEDHLHELVCQGKVQLTTAQSDLASDWVAAYKRYFNTDIPPSNAATLDSPSNPGAESSQAEAAVMELPVL